MGNFRVSQPKIFTHKEKSLKMPKMESNPHQVSMQWTEYVVREARDRAKPNSRGFPYNTWLTEEQLKQNVDYFNNKKSQVEKSDWSPKWNYGPVGKTSPSTLSEKAGLEKEEEKTGPESAPKKKQVKFESNSGYDRQFHTHNDYEEKLHRCDRASRLGLDIGSEGTKKAAPCLSNSVYGSAQPIEDPFRKHVRVEHVYKGFFRPRGTGIPLGDIQTKL